MTTSAIPQPPFARTLGALLALGALVAAMVITASPADAHARLEGTSPQDGATLSAVPPEVMLRFNEPIQQGLNQVSVKSGSTDVAKGDPQVDGKNVYQPIEYTMEPGEYTVTYKVVSADGHPVSGSYSFTYAPPEGDGKVEEDSDATPYSPSETSSAADRSSETSAPDETTDEGGDPTPSETSGTTPSETSAEGSGASPSGSATTGDGTNDEASGSTDAASEEGTSPWWWALAAGALVVVVGGLVMLVRGRRDSDDSEDQDLPRE